VLIEPWGNPKALDLAASRRLALAAARSNLPLFMVRAGATPEPSAAMTRWRVRSALSVELEANAPGHPAFGINLLRLRGGASGQTWIVEWDRDLRAFKDLPKVSGGMVPLPVGGPRDAAEGVRQAG
jgi:protein ImuA